MLSQYAGSPVICSLISSFEAAMDPRGNIQNFLQYIWNVNTAVGYGLDVWGTIVGVSRVVPSSPPITLDDTDYRTLILVKAAANIGNVTIPTLNRLFRAIFSGQGLVYVEDNLNMSLTDVFKFVPTPAQQAIVEYSGVLPRPAGVEVTYTWSLTVTITPTTQTSISLETSQTTGVSTGVVGNGTGPYTYAWTWQSGGTGITITSPTAIATSFSASGMTRGEVLTGVALLTVTETSSGRTATGTVTVEIECASVLTCAASPTTLSVTGAASSLSTGTTVVTPTGGGTPYTYAWTWNSGGTDITINSPTSASTKFTGTGLAPSSAESGTALCTVTDFYGQTATCTVGVEITRVSLLTASGAPSSLSVTGAAAMETTGNCTVTAANGQTPYTYAWSWQSGGAGIDINSPSAAATDFSSTGLSPGTSATGVAQCIVTDYYGQTTTVTCDVSLTRVSEVSASVSPETLSSNGTATSQTTGAATVSASGGSGSYTYEWAWQSGGAGIGINSPAANATSFTASGMTPGDTYSGVAQCTVTDGYGQQTIVTVGVSIACVALSLVAAENTYEGEFPFIGYIEGGAGSLTPDTLSDGRQVVGLGELDSASIYLEIVGFPSNPGATYIETMTINGATYYGSSATFSASGAGETWSCQWTWPKQNDLTIGTTYPVAVAHS